MSSILVTGFAPFDGRQVNSSWVAACAMPASHGDMAIDTVELPVEWGVPRERLSAICGADSPAIILSMGEGRVGWFDIETVARNRRKVRRDNTGSLPPAAQSWPEGADRMVATVRAGPVRDALAEPGYPVRISTDAGGFLCEETLFALESLKRRREGLLTTLFVHLPPFATPLSVAGTERQCDEALLGDFALHLLDVVVAEYRREIAAVTP